MGPIDKHLPSKGGQRLSFAESMALLQLDHMTFRSIAPPYSPGRSPATFGGHVLAQAVYAAAQTVAKGSTVHNVHGYFTLPGVPSRPFFYRVEKIRSGHSYSTRSVTVRQPDESGSLEGSEICFTCMCSFKPDEESQTEYGEAFDEIRYQGVLEGKRPEDHSLAPGADAPWAVKMEKRYGPEIDYQGVEVRKVDMTSYNDGKSPLDYRQLQYYRAVGPLPEDDLNLHACAHIYASDRNSLFVITNALGVSNGLRRMASISHSVVFHVPARDLVVDKEYFIQEAWTDRSAGGRGMHASKLWSPSGLHVATTFQDGLVKWDPELAETRNFQLKGRVSATGVSTSKI